MTILDMAHSMRTLPSKSFWRSVFLHGFQYKNLLRQGEFLAIRYEHGPLNPGVAAGFLMVSTAKTCCASAIPLHGDP